MFLPKRVTFLDEETVAIQMSDLGIELPTQRKFKDSGQMIAPATIARTGIMEYKASECGAMFADRDPDSIVKIATLAEDLFDEESIESYRAAPITIGHPAVDVTIENSKELQHGHLEGVPFKDTESVEGVELLAANIVLTDEEGINVVETQAQQLSSGHSCVLVLGDENDEWDAKKTNIRANHVAIVKRGRAGVTEIADEAPEENDSPENPEVDLNDQLTTLSDENAELKTQVQVLKDQLEEEKQKLTDAEAAHKAEIKSSVSFLVAAQKLTDTDISEMDIVEAKRHILQDQLGKDLKDKDDAYINLRYEILLEDGIEEDDKSLSRMLDDTVTPPTVEPKVDPVQAARERMIKRFEHKEG